MADSPDSGTKQSTSNESESSTGFRSFWRKSDRSAGPQNVQFVEQDPSGKRSESRPSGARTPLVKDRPNQSIETSRLARLLGQGSSGVGSDQLESSDKTSAAAKRRQQVYQAQK